MKISFDQIIYKMVLIIVFHFLNVQSTLEAELLSESKPITVLFNSSETNLIMNESYSEYASIKDNDLRQEQTYELESRQNRATPRKTVHQCNISIDELNDLNIAINSVVLNVSQTIANCSFTTKLNNNCVELIKLIQCGIQKIKMVHNNSTTEDMSPENYKKLNNLYRICNNKLIRIKDVIEALVDQKYKNAIDKLTNDMQSLAKELSDSKYEIFEKTIILCAAEIHIGHVANSLIEYNKLTENNKILILTKIVDKTFTYVNKYNSVRNLLTFTEKISNKCQQFAAYLILIGRMQKENHLNCRFGVFWETLKNTAENWNKQIFIEKITECPNDYMENFETFLHKIIKQMYSKCFSIVENGLQFVNELLTNDQKVIAYPILFEEMKKRNGLNGYEIVLLGYRIQEILMNQTSENLTSIIKLKKELPSGLIVLMSSGAIRLKSKALIDSNFGISPGEVGAVACSASVDQNQDWIIRVRQKGRYFEFLNAANAYSLRSQSTKECDISGTCDSSLWKIIPIANGASFYIKNKYNHNILGVDLKSQLPNACCRVTLFPTYTGDNYLQWEIKRKI